MSTESEGDDWIEWLEQEVLRPLRSSAVHLLHLSTQGEAGAGSGPHGGKGAGTQVKEELLLCEGVRLATRGPPIV